ncbi:tetratricopeptide repeat protein [Stieleria sp. JC731]|uniref:tetratricopeptide repeat protein n=1 Tax=Pirellulaceae TaxID=2691357 RepID=UPI001E3905B8|nr:tetratricopeptide repeat protein [Stieleria sp. JC731]MCC9602470.1 tetratricopeptide repeat protein [Stieleria sp. JC731]
MLHRLPLLSLLVLASSVSVLAQQPSESQIKLAQQASQSLMKQDYDAAAKAAQSLAETDMNLQQVSLCADVLLRCGKVDESVKLFDRYAEARPQAKPYLWQRGIALFFAGKFDEGAKQFEIHREVNSNDVENAAWHFLCVAKSKSPDEAKKLLLPAPGDWRIPMEEVLQLLHDGNTERVISKMESTEEDSSTGKSARFYGHLYLGLYADAMGDETKAKAEMKKSVSFAGANYMGDVARVYLERLSQKD